MRAIKKGMILGLSIAMVLSFSACGDTKEKVDNSAGNSTVNDENMEIEKDSTDQVVDKKNEGDSKDEKLEETLMIFGKVKSVVGNEIEIDLANTEAFGGTSNSEEDMEGEEVPASGMAASITASAISEDEAGAMEAKPNKMELEYTGETKSFIIPAGMSITGLTGMEATMTDIKEGSVLLIMANGSKETPDITSIQIVE